MPYTLSQILFNTVYHYVIGDTNSPYNFLIKKMYDIEADYFQGIPNNTERLDIHLNPTIRDRVVDNFKKMTGFYLGSSFEKVVFDIIRGNIQTYYPDADPQTIAKACEKAKEEVIESAKYRFCHKEYTYEEPCRPVSETALMTSYQKAKTRTLIERFNQINKADVLNFYHTLLRKTKWDCKQLIEAKTIQFMEDVLNKFI